MSRVDFQFDPVAVVPQGALSMDRAVNLGAGTALSLFWSPVWMLAGMGTALWAAREMSGWWNRPVTPTHSLDADDTGTSVQPESEVAAVAETVAASALLEPEAAPAIETPVVDDTVQALESLQAEDVDTASADIQAVEALAAAAQPPVDPILAAVETASSSEAPEAASSAKASRRRPQG